MVLPITFDLARQITDQTAIASLAGSRDPLARLGIASNPETPGPLLAMLSFDESPPVRLAAALHPGLPRGDQVRMHDELEALLLEVEPSLVDAPEQRDRLRQVVERVIAEGGG